jgi:hypothetical protein
LPSLQRGVDNRKLPTELSQNQAALPKEHGNLKKSATRCAKQTSFPEVGARPADSIPDQSVAATWKHLRSLVFRKTELVGESFDRVGESVLAPVPQELEQGQHERLKVRNRHGAPSGCPTDRALQEQQLAVRAPLPLALLGSALLSHHFEAIDREDARRLHCTDVHDVRTNEGVCARISREGLEQWVLEKKPSDVLSFFELHLVMEESPNLRGMSQSLRPAPERFATRGVDLTMAAGVAGLHKELQIRSFDCVVGVRDDWSRCPRFLHRGGLVVGPIGGARTTERNREGNRCAEDASSTPHCLDLTGAA